VRLGSLKVNFWLKCLSRTFYRSGALPTNSTSASWENEPNTVHTHTHTKWPFFRLDSCPLDSQPPLIFILRILTEKAKTLHIFVDTIPLRLLQASPWSSCINLDLTSITKTLSPSSSSSHSQLRLAPPWPCSTACLQRLAGFRPMGDFTFWLSLSLSLLLSET